MIATQEKYSALVLKAVSQGKVPQCLFKYRTLNSNFDNIIVNKQLWFSNPDAFNDPFDCQVKSDTDNTANEIKEFVIKTSKKGISTSEVNKIVSDLIDNPKKWDALINDKIKKVINASGVCCFGGNEENQLLWSHYTDSHKGICLKFDVTEDPEFFSVPLKVTYQKNYPKYNHLRDSNKLADIILSTKSDLWAYEEEVRVVKMKTGLHSFKPKALKEIIFGCKSDDKEIKRIKILTSKSDLSHVVFKKASTKSNQYGLKFAIV